MRTLLWNLLLALVWAAMTARFSLANLLLGYLLGYAVLWLASPRDHRSRYFGKALQVLAFTWVYVRDLWLATVRVAYDVVTPAHHMKPVVIGLPLEKASDAEITLLANLITLTPGSLTLDVSPDRKTLYLHAMYGGDDVEALRRHLKNTLERRVLELTR